MINKNTSLNEKLLNFFWFQIEYKFLHCVYICIKFLTSITSYCLYNTELKCIKSAKRKVIKLINF